MYKNVFYNRLYINLKTSKPMFITVRNLKLQFYKFLVFSAYYNIERVTTA